MLLAVSAPVVMAEDEDGTEYEEIIAKPVTAAKPRARTVARPRSAQVKRAEPEPKLPDAPIPYESLSNKVSAAAGVTEHMEHRVIKTLPAPVPVQAGSAPVSPVQNLPDAITAPVIAAPVREPVPEFAPEFAPEFVPPPPPPPAFVSGEVLNLKCETQVVAGNRLVSQGAFYLEITPSDVFADSARYKVMFADPQHESLIKETLCETVSCTIRISSNFYELFNQRTKKGKSLKATLDRRNGAYLAQDRDKEVDAGTYEQGYCLPQGESRKLF
ncbi:MAG: hypothetical protein QM645_10475 [Asticcacaulis sp.]